MSALSRRQLLAATAASTLTLALPPRMGRAADLKQITLAEPAHLFPYVPVYVAIDQGFFAKHGLDVKLTMVLGGGHVAALVSGSVWGNLGGAESDAMSNNGTADPLKAICNFVNRAICARKRAPNRPRIRRPISRRFAKAKNWRSAATAARPTCWHGNGSNRSASISRTT
jgi:ABC-type nitrate/sulfonate/bicarbonate transport system substrate-binding protein